MYLRDQDDRDRLSVRSWCRPARRAPLGLQARYQTSGLVTDDDRTAVRVLREVRPDEHAVPVEPTLEDAYLLALDSG